ncbi:MAG: transposase-like protein [Myxococcota bacterium]|jgi:transposase-like protein
MAPRPTRRHYSREERDRALALADDKGLLKAARELGIPKSTLSNWRRRTAPANLAKPVQPTPQPDPPTTPAKPTSQKRYTSSRTWSTPSAS